MRGRALIEDLCTRLRALSEVEVQAVGPALERFLVVLDRVQAVRTAVQSGKLEIDLNALARRFLGPGVRAARAKRADRRSR